MVLCLIVGCGTRTGKAHTHREKVRLFRVPRVITNQGEHVDGLTSTRRRQWISAINRANLTAEKLETERVCGKHFVSGQPSKHWDQFSVDWVLWCPITITARYQKMSKWRQPIVEYFSKVY